MQGAGTDRPHRLWVVGTCARGREVRVQQRERGLEESDLRVVEFRGRTLTCRLEEEWSALHEASGAVVFLSPEWLRPWLKYIAPRTEPRLLCVRDRDGRLVGMLPLGMEETRGFGRKIRRLFVLGDRHVGSDYLDVVARLEHRRAVTLALARHLRDVQAGWDVLDLGDLEATSPTAGWMQEVLGGGDWAWRSTPRFTCPFERLEPGGDFDAFLQRTGRRDNFLRRLRWFEKQEGFRVEVARQPGELEPAAEAFFQLHRLRWAADGGSQGIRGSGVEAFHREAMRGLAEKGKLRLITLWLGARAVASVYGIVQGSDFLYYQSGYDPAWRAKSPGLVLVGLSFRDAMAEGLERYDFLRGTEPYKSEWTRRKRATRSWRCTFRHGPGEWLTRSEEASLAIRGRVRGLLPAPIVEAVRRYRRRASAIVAGETTWLPARRRRG